MTYKLPKDTVENFRNTDNLSLYCNKYRIWEWNHKKRKDEIQDLPCVDTEMYSDCLENYQSTIKNIIYHHIYGIPYIPGSGIKGSLRNMYILELFNNMDIEDENQITICENVLETFDLEKDIELKQDKFCSKFKKNNITPNAQMFNYFKSDYSVIKQYQLIFGNQEKKGKVIFIEAFPCFSFELKNDVMTPHYSEYYSDGKPPADYYDPVPICL